MLKRMLFLLQSAMAILLNYNDRNNALTNYIQKHQQKIYE